MASKAERGTKRTCQNEECASHFYDLNRDPIICPICGATYVIASAPLPEPDAEQKKETNEKKTVDADGDSDDALDDAEGIEDIEDSDDIGDDDDNDTFLADDDEDSDAVPKIIVGGKKGTNDDDD